MDGVEGQLQEVSGCDVDAEARKIEMMNVPETVRRQSMTMAQTRSTHFIAFVRLALARV